MSSPFSVVAIIAAYNEADIIQQVVGDLIEQDVWVYLLDDGSTDGTVAAVEPYVGRGVLGIERLSDSVTDPAPAGFDWERILLRKAQLAAELDATWFIHHDADEFRESPWAHVSLRDAIRKVDALGYNAIDFAGFDFWPTHDRFRPGDDVRTAFTFCSDGAAYDRIQIRCWKKTEHPIDLASSGGHDASFPGRRVFPVRFILRHYPIRGQAHGERKVFQERRSRFVERERVRGWHVQYDDIREGASFLRDPSTLTAYDADAVRLGLTLRHHDVEALEQALACARSDVNQLQEQIAQSQRELAAARAEIDARSAHGAALEAEIERWRASVDGLSRRLEEFQGSLSWRWTAPARRAYRVLRGR